MRRASFFLFLILTMLDGTALRAQVDWAQVPSGTTRHLWGVAHGGAQFVAVGEGGTVLTSPDGTVWTARQAGTDRWLLAAAFAPPLQRWVIVGDAGTVLTSADGMNWTAANSATTQRLNGVAYGDGRFLAVGEGGVVCASTDGLTWTSTVLPDSRWLRGVTFGGGQFLIGGEHAFEFGLAVYSTRDGVSFTLASTALGFGTVEALAYDGATFAAAGSAFSFAPGNFPLTWQTRIPSPGSGVPVLPYRYFRGVAFFNNAWIAVGELRSDPFATSTPIVYAHFNTPAWRDAAGLSPALKLNAVAASGSAAVAVGPDGLIARSAAAQLPPEPFLLGNAPGVVARIGTTVELAADARGSLPLAYQWNFDGRPIPGATQRTLTLSDVTLAQSGRYTLSATNGFGTSTSPAYALTVVSPLAVPAPVDPDFVAPLTAEPGAVSLLPDGRLLLIASTTPAPVGSEPRRDLVRLNRDGSIDSSFRTSADVGNARLQLLRNGQILLGRSDVMPGGIVYSRLLHDGTVDPAFTPLSHSGSFIGLEDGRLLLATLAANVLTLTGIDANGAPDPSIPALELVLGPPAPEAAFDPTFRTLLTARTATGEIYLAAISHESVGTGIFGRNETKLIRLLRNGTLSGGVITLSDAIEQLVSVNGKLTYVSSRRGALGSIITSRSTRVHADGSDDSTYRSFTLTGGVAALPIIRLAPDGSIYVVTASTRSREIVRYTSDGLRDEEFSARFADPIAFDLLPVGDGTLFALGNFTGLNGTRASYLARLTPDTRASATRLTNLAVRQRAGTGNDTLILGFVIAGQGDQLLLLRGIGPSLSAFGLGELLEDPRIALYDRRGAGLLANDNWAESADSALLEHAAMRVNTFPLARGSKDAAAIAQLQEGPHTLQVGFRGAPGLALAEGYDLGITPVNYAAARLVNFSVRTLAGTGDTTLIAGFTVTGPGAKRVLIRGVGPSLAQFGLTHAIPDPQLTVFRGSTPIAANDNVAEDDEMRAAVTATGAFPLSGSGKDAALLLTVPAGSYTVWVTNVDPAQTGVALAEVYEVR